MKNIYVIESEVLEDKIHLTSMVKAIELSKIIIKNKDLIITNKVEGIASCVFTVKKNTSKKQKQLKLLGS